MAGLIWLWQNIGGTTPPPISTDYGITPQLLEIINGSPSFIIDPTTAQFYPTTTTYNQSNVSYNSSSQIYGGFGGSASYGPQLSFINNGFPQIILEDPFANILSLGTTVSVLTTTTTTYNQSSVSYNSSSQVYGGVGRSKDPAPQFYKVGNK
jgi:hypothetical protein